VALKILGVALINHVNAITPKIFQRGHLAEGRPRNEQDE
jgi:hypothetical protein